MPALVFMHLLELHYDKPIDKNQWWPLRFVKPGNNLSYRDGVHIVKNGPNTDDRGDKISYKHFMNGALFGNINNLFSGEDTISFFEYQYNHQPYKKLF